MLKKYMFFILFTVIGFAQQMTIEYGLGYTDGVMSSGGDPWKPAISYDFGGSTYYLVSLEVKMEGEENNMGWLVTSYGTTTPTLNVIGDLSGTFNSPGINWVTVNVNSGTALTGKVAFIVETAIGNNIYNDFDANDPNGDWMYYNPDGQWYHNSDYGGGANALRAIVSTENPLPVEMVSFNARVFNNSVMLDWETATEKNNYGFEIQRNIPVENKTEKNVVVLNNVKNSDWDVVGFVNGNGNANIQNKYSFVDKSVTSGNYVYRLKQIDVDGKFTYSNFINVTMDKPAEFNLEQNYPNPFNPSTKLSFNLDRDEFTNLTIYNILGEKVKTIVNGQLEKGNYSFIINGNDMASGTYIYTLTAGNKQISKKMNLVK